VKSFPALLVLLVIVGCKTRSNQNNGNNWYDPTLGHKILGKNDLCWGYRVGVEVSDPGCRIEVNEELVATLTNTTVGEIILWGYRDGRFRENQSVRIVANPVKSGQHQQVKTFYNQREREHIPHKMYFDLNLEPVKPTEKVDVRVR
jgi:hypothetical protein